VDTRSDRTPAADFFRPLPGVTARVSRRNRTIVLRVDPKAIAPEAARAFLYRALDSYESRFSVFISGVPFCFLPDAYDHVLPPRGGGKPMRVPVCRRCRLRRLCPGLPQGSLFKGRPVLLKPVLELPNEIVLEVNRRCNLACTVCTSRALDAQLSLPDIRRHLARARALGIKNIRFTGGEPFLHPGILKALAAAKKLGFYVLVNTNATLLDRALIKKAAPFIDNILVSLQGWDAASEAAATGTPGLFAKKIAAIRLLRGSGIPVLRLGTVISGPLLRTPERCLRLAQNLEADVWELYRPMAPDGKGPAAVSVRALRHLAARLEPLAGKKPLSVFANPVPFCLFKKSQAPLLLGARFDDGHSRLVLDPRGFYKPSYYIQEDLGTDPLRAWNSRFLKNLCGPVHLRGKCSRCVFRLRCLGGSRFMAKGARGTYCAKDPLLAPAP